MLFREKPNSFSVDSGNESVVISINPPEELPGKSGVNVLTILTL
jgi:hypothetical protein